MEQGQDGGGKGGGGGGGTQALIIILGRCASPGPENLTYTDQGTVEPRYFELS